MARTIRFHLDENCHPAIAEGLSHSGVDVTTTPYCGKDMKSIGEIITMLMLIFEVYTPEEMANRVEFI
jgi:hypothetical protein